MSSLLKRSQVVTTETSGLPCVVDSYLGGGGQGEVYSARWAGNQVALKWYFAHQATREQHDALRRLVELGAPTQSFLWPLEIAVNPTALGFGYIMPLRDSRYKSIVDLMKRTAEPGFRALMTAAIELSASFLELHARGLCYRDVSFGNVFFDPDSGEVLICDNDNVAIDGLLRRGVLGTPRFMAPEIVRGEAAPSILTDIYSLAVLLFYLLMVHHPLEGRREAAIKCLDLPAMNRLYGEQPLFIFDPDDDSNAPVPVLHENAIAFWHLYPQSIRRLFVRSFTEGLREPQKRVRESEWRSTLIRARDLIVVCHCGQESFYCERSHGDAGADLVCWCCGQGITLPPRLMVPGQTVMLNRDVRLFGRHTERDRSRDLDAPTAVVVENPGRPGQLGLRNMSGRIWRVVTPDGAQGNIEPNRSVAIAQGMRIDFGSVVGEIAL